MAEVGVAHPIGAGLAGEPTGTASLDAVAVASGAIDAERKAATPSPDVAFGCDTGSGSRRRGSKDVSRGGSAGSGPATGNRATAAGKQSSGAPAARKPAARSASGGLMGCAPSWADKTWHPMAVTVASGQIRNGGTGVFIPGGMRPAAGGGGGCANSGTCGLAAASSGISTSSMSSSISAAGSGGPGSPQGSPAAPGSPAGDADPKQTTPGGHAPLPRPVSAPSAHLPLLPSCAAFPQGGGYASGGHNLGTGAFIPATGRAAYASARRSLDVRPTQPPLGASVGPVRRTSDSHLIGGPAGGPAGANNAANAASAAAAAAAAVDAAAQALAAAQAAAAAAGGDGVSSTDSITMQLAMMQLQQQQAQLQQLQQQAELQQQLQALQRESLLAQLQGDAGGLLTAASAPCNILPDHAHNGGFLSGDNLWATTRSGAFLSHASLADSAAFAPHNPLGLSTTGLVGGFGSGLLSPASSVPQPVSAAPNLIGCSPVDLPGPAQSPMGLGGGIATTFGAAPGISAASNISGGGMASGPLLSGLTAGLGTIEEAQAGVGTFNLRGAATTSFTGQW